MFCFLRTMGENKNLKMKRLFDLFFAGIGLVILLPVFAAAGLLVKLSGKGPVFFKQERIGRNGQPFVFYKFRTMQVLESAEKGSFDAGDVSRVTSAGKFLRKTKIDELPQLFNVIKGEMSLVGPRPEVKKWVAVYPERWQKVLSVLPGITDNASIFFRNEEEMLCQSADPESTYREIVLPQKLDYYEDYVANHSFFGDVKLIFQTIYCCLLLTKER